MPYQCKEFRKYVSISLPNYTQKSFVTVAGEVEKAFVIKNISER
jgi:hypothetical protein